MFFFQMFRLIDYSTRLVLFDFVLYNPALQVHIACRIGFEMPEVTSLLLRPLTPLPSFFLFSPFSFIIPVCSFLMPDDPCQSGGVIPFHEFEVIDLQRYWKDSSPLSIFLEMLLLGSILIFLFNVCRPPFWFNFVDCLNDFAFI